MIKAKKRIGDILLENNLVTKKQIEWLLEEKEQGEKFGDAAIRLGIIAEEQLLETLQKQTGTSSVNLNTFPIKQEALDLIPETYALENLIIPLEIRGRKILVALNDPLDFFILDDIRMLTGLVVEPMIALKSEINNAINKFYGFTNTLKNLGLEDIQTEIDMQQKQKIQNLSGKEESPVAKLVNQILATALSSRASDIHIDSSDSRIAIRYRVDGVLRTEQELPRSLISQITSRIKVMAKMRIQETRRPQDGRIQVNIEGKVIDLRISTLPTVHGEKIVMRILDLSNNINGIKGIGLNKKDEEKLERLIKKPNGVVLVSGPTGSGKSTTLYSALSELNDEETNIITVEDPVELQLPGVNQVQVRADIDLTFASALRSILRQDPNIIMIGEIRDSETAEIAVRAALTGHLVLSTIHTNDAIRTISRLEDMGVEKFLVASSLVGVISQRLVRRVCPICSITQAPTVSEKALFKKNGYKDKDIPHLRKKVGCPSCNNSGYKGRTGIFEILEINDSLRKMISNEVDFITMAKQAKKDGLKTLLEYGLEKVVEGVTTLEELLKATLE